MKMREQAKMPESSFQRVNLPTQQPYHFRL